MNKENFHSDLEIIIEAKSTFFYSTKIFTLFIQQNSSSIVFSPSRNFKLIPDF